MNTSVREKAFWTIYACFLILLFLMSSTDLIIKEKTQEIFKVSVIVDDSKDDYYANFRKGMDQAAIDYHLDVSFITLYERNSVSQQKDMIARELNDGAQAIVLAPASDVECARILEEAGTNIPVIILNSEMSVNQVQTNITADYYEAGRQMAAAVAEENGVEIPVYIFTEGLSLGSNLRFYDGIMSILENGGYEITLVDQAAYYGYNGILNHLVNVEKTPAVVIALDSETLVTAADALEGREDAKNRIRLYGAGATMKILNYVDKGVIRGIFTTNQYDAGYLSMEKAVEAIQNRSEKGAVTLGYFYLEKDDILKKEYEKMLYPIS